MELEMWSQIRYHDCANEREESHALASDTGSSTTEMGRQVATVSCSCLQESAAVIHLVWQPSQRFTILWSRTINVTLWTQFTAIRWVILILNWYVRSLQKGFSNGSICELMQRNVFVNTSSVKRNHKPNQWPKLVVLQLLRKNLTIDFIGPLPGLAEGYMFIFIIICCLTRFAELYSMSRGNLTGTWNTCR